MRAKQFVCHWMLFFFIYCFLFLYFVFTRFFSRYFWQYSVHASISTDLKRWAKEFQSQLTVFYLKILDILFLNLYLFHGIISFDHIFRPFHLTTCVAMWMSVCLTTCTVHHTSARCTIKSQWGLSALQLPTNKTIANKISITWAQLSSMAK